MIALCVVVFGCGTPSYPPPMFDEAVLARAQSLYECSDRIIGKAVGLHLRVISCSRGSLVRSPQAYEDVTFVLSREGRVLKYSVTYYYDPKRPLVTSGLQFELMDRVVPPLIAASAYMRLHMAVEGLFEIWKVREAIVSVLKKDELITITVRWDDPR